MKEKQKPTLRQKVLQSHFFFNGIVSIHLSNLFNPECHNARWGIVNTKNLTIGLTYYPIINWRDFSLTRYKRTYVSLSECLGLTEGAQKNEDSI